MPTIEELKQQANAFMNKDDFKAAVPFYLKIWESEKNETNGKALAKSYRKAGNFEEAYSLHTKLYELYPNSGGIKLDKLWLDYSSKIKDWNNVDLIQDAEILLSKTDKYNKFTGSIFSKTVLSVVKHLIYNQDNDTALIWLDKLDFTVLTNSPFTIGGQKYASDQKAFFVRYADVLVKLNKHVEYLESCLSCIRIEGIKQTQFKKYILENITYQDYNGYTQITRLRFALYLKYFKEEISNRKKNAFTKTFVPNKITSVSELGDFEFCPVSFAINATYEISSNATWEKDEWLGEKKHLIDRYNDYQKTKNITEVFKDSAIEVNDAVKSDFIDIFNSKLVINNFDGSSQTYFSNPTDTIRGNPDYVFESTSGKRFAVIEKFTKRTSEAITTAFTNDLIKLYGYIFELTTLNIDFGYLIYWYWKIDDIQDDNGNIKKKIRIRTYRIFKIEKTSENKTKLATSIEKVNTFKQKSKFEVDGDRISYPNKCLNCSVVSYCNHKTGKFNIVNLPYDISSITVNGQPTININSPTVDNTNSDDLAF